MEVPRCHSDTREQEEVEGLCGIWKEGSSEGNYPASTKATHYTTANDDE